MRGTRERELAPHLHLPFLRSLFSNLQKQLCCNYSVWLKLQAAKHFSSWTNHSYLKHPGAHVLLGWYFCTSSNNKAGTNRRKGPQMDGRSLFIRREMMIQSQHVELKYKLFTATWLTFAINHIFYCQKCMLISFSVKNHHLCVL